MSDAQDIGTARLNVEVDVSDLEAAVSKAKSRLADMSSDAQRQYQAMDAAGKRHVDVLLKRADTLGMTQSQQLAYNAALNTSGPVLEEVTRRIAANEAALRKGGAQFNAYGLSAKQTAAAMRQVPMQLTDIFVGLATGQRPMMILLQQGGQLKDLFGGIVPATQALGGALLKLVNPYTLAAGAAAGLIAALADGQKQAFEFEKAILLSGNAAGVTASQLANMADRLDGFSGTQRDAASLLTQMASTGRISASEMELAAKAATRLQSVVGISTEETIRNLVALGEKPTEASRKLNQQYHYLNEASLARIRTLEEEGRASESAALAQREFSNAGLQRADELEKHLGVLPSLARGAGKAFSEMWEGLMGLGHAKTPDEILADIERRLAGGSGGGFVVDAGGGIAPGPSRAERRLLERQALDIRNKQLNAEWAAARGADFVRSEEARAAALDRWAKIEESSLTRRQKMEKEISEIRTVGLAARKSEAEVEIQIAAVRERYATAPKANADDNSAKSLIESIERQIEANTLLVATGEKATASDNLAIKARQMLAEATNTMTDAQRMALIARLPELEASAAAAENWQKEAKAKEELVRQTDALARQSAALTLVESNQTRSNAIDLMGMGRGADAMDQLRRRLDIQLVYQGELDKLRDIGVAKDSESWANQERHARETMERMLQNEERFQRERLLAMMDPIKGARAAWEDYVFTVRNASSQTYELISGAFDEAGMAIAEFASGGKLSFSSLADSIISDLARLGANKLLMMLVGAFTPLGAVQGAGTRIIPNAKGGVYDVPGLSAFSNQIVSKPTIVPFARGGVLFGEAGSEAIMPLKRTQGGQLGVVATGGGGGVNVHIHGAPSTPSVSKRRNANGGFDIDVVFRAMENHIADSIASGGTAAAAIKSRFAVSERV